MLVTWLCDMTNGKFLACLWTLIHLRYIEAEEVENYQFFVGIDVVTICCNSLINLTKSVAYLSNSIPTLQYPYVEGHIIYFKIPVR